MDNEDIIEYLQTNSTQQEQLIDILMVLLSLSSPEEAGFLDYAHNTRKKFLSSLTKEEYAQLRGEFERDSH